MASLTSGLQKCWPLFVVLVAAIAINVCSAGDGINLKPKIKAKIGVEWDTAKPKHHHHGEHGYHGEYGLDVHGGAHGGLHGGAHAGYHHDHYGHHGGHHSKMGKLAKGGALMKVAAMLKGSKHRKHHGSHHGHYGGYGHHGSSLDLHHGSHHDANLGLSSDFNVGVGVGHGGVGLHAGVHGEGHGGYGHEAYGYNSNYGAHGGYHGNGLTHQGTLSGGAHVNAGLHLSGSATAKLSRLPGVGRLFATPHQQELMGVMKDEKAKLKYSLDRYHKSVKRAPYFSVGLLNKKKGITSEVLEDAVDVARHHNNVKLLKAAINNKTPTDLVFAPRRRLSNGEFVRHRKARNNNALIHT